MENFVVKNEESTCEFCSPVLHFFRPVEEHTEAHRNYEAALDALREMVSDERIEFVAGDCPLFDIEKHIDLEDLYTVKHYFRCRCGKIFFTGVCCRGVAICKIKDKIPTNPDYRDGGYKYGSGKV